MKPSAFQAHVLKCMAKGAEIHGKFNRYGEPTDAILIKTKRTAAAVVPRRTVAAMHGRGWIEDIVLNLWTITQAGREAVKSE